MKSLLAERELMIDPTVLSVVEKRVTQDIENRLRSFAQEVGQIKRKLQLNGMSNSRGVTKCIQEAIGNEFRVRTSLIWNALARGLDAKRITLSDDKSSELKQHIARMLDTGSGDLRKHYQKLAGIMKGAIPGKSLEELRAAALERVCTEIDYATLKQSEPAQQNVPAINIYQSFGIVQTGTGSSASLSISLGSEEISEIKKALEAVKQTIEKSTSLASDERNQIFELVSDIETEIHRDRPNKLKIRGALQGIAMTIQTIAAAPEAYQLLKGAASLMGLQLP
jgi:hypothetical protein